MIHFKNNQKGYVVSVITFFVLVLMLSIALSTSLLTLWRQKIATNSVKSSQSYYAAESGIEDALWRLNNNPSYTGSYSLTVNNATTSVTIPSAVGGAVSITSQGNNTNIIKSINTVYSTGGTNVNFYYGVDVGAGGLTMSGSSEVVGNVFANGSISMAGSSKIDNSVVVSGSGNNVNGTGNDTIGGNVLAYTCTGSGVSITGNLTYVAGASPAPTCIVHGTKTTQSGQIAQSPMPIPQSQIDAWKTDATNGGACSTSNLSGSQAVSMGPCKITGNLTIGGSAKLTLTGTIYVTGNISISNSGKVSLSSTYESLGGVLISDGTIALAGSSSFSGSGQTGSYVLLLSTNSSLSTSNPALNIGNSGNGAVVFYTSAGLLNVTGSASLVEATGYAVNLGNSAKIQYSTGLINIYFSNGPGGGWKVSSWTEQ